jgi:hypothetical protein
VDKVKEYEVGGARSTHGKEQKSAQSFVGKARRKETTRKTETQTGRSVWFLGRLDGERGVEWIQLAQDKN